MEIDFYGKVDALASSLIKFTNEAWRMRVESERKEIRDLMSLIMASAYQLANSHEEEYEYAYTIYDRIDALVQICCPWSKQKLEKLAQEIVSLLP